VGAEGVVEGAFAGMAEGRVADVVNQGEGFDKVLVEAEGGGDGAGDLGDFHGVGEAGAEVVGEGGGFALDICALSGGGAVGEDLRLAGQAAESAGMDDAGAVTLERGAVGVGWFGVLAVGERVVGVVGDCAGLQGLGWPGHG
jgi:hypothetical protein